MSTATGRADTMGAMAGMSNAPARDANQEFLRMMIDHHEGLVVMADTALKKAATADVRSDAAKLRSKQKQEQQQMQDMLKAKYGEEKTPMVIPGDASMISMLAGTSGSAFDRSFREHVILHHAEGIKMSDQFLARLTNAEVRQMAEKMKADQTRDRGAAQKAAGELSSEHRRCGVECRGKTPEREKLFYAE